MKRADLRAPARASRHALWHRTVVGVIVIALALPPVAVLVHSLTPGHSEQGLLGGVTLRWYAALWGDPRFLGACERSLLVCGAALVISTTLAWALLLTVRARFARLDALMRASMLVCAAVPPVVSAASLAQWIGRSALAHDGAPWILTGSYVTLALPFIYRCAGERLASAPQRAAGLLSGADIGRALAVALLLCAPLLSAEFAFASVLAGASYETLPVYLYGISTQDGHAASALATIYFLFVLASMWVARRLGRGRREQPRAHQLF